MSFILQTHLYRSIFLLPVLINIQIFVRRYYMEIQPYQRFSKLSAVILPHLFYKREKAEDICWLAIYIDCPQCIIFIVLPYKYILWITVRGYYSIWKGFFVLSYNYTCKNVVILTTGRTRYETDFSGSTFYLKYFPKWALFQWT